MLLTHIAQLMTHTTNVYVAATYLAIMLLSLLVYCRGLLRAKGCLYHVNTVQVDIVPLRKIYG